MVLSQHQITESKSESHMHKIIKTKEEGNVDIDIWDAYIK